MTHADAVPTSPRPGLCSGSNQRSRWSGGSWRPSRTSESDSKHGRPLKLRESVEDSLGRALQARCFEAACPGVGNEFVGREHARRVAGGGGADDALEPWLEAHRVIEHALCAYDLQETEAFLRVRSSASPRGFALAIAALFRKERIEGPGEGRSFRLGVQEHR